MMIKSKTIIYIVLQCIWGALQTIVGGVVFLFLIRNSHSFHKGCIVTLWGNKTSASIGLFVFLSDKLDGDMQEKVLAHEYGHTLQSVMLGPLYLPIISLPSMLWCMLPVFIKYRAEKSVSYYSFYTERWANLLGKVTLY